MLFIDLAILFGVATVVAVAAGALGGPSLGQRLEARRRRKQGEKNAADERRKLVEKCAICGEPVDPAVDLWERNEGLPINVDVSLNFTLESARVPAIYVKFRGDLDHIKQMFMRQSVREGLQEVFAKYTAEQLYSTKRQEARVEVQKFLSERLGVEG